MTTPPSHRSATPATLPKVGLLPLCPFPVSLSLLHTRTTDGRLETVPALLAHLVFVLKLCYNLDDPAGMPLTRVSSKDAPDGAVCYLLPWSAWLHNISQADPILDTEATVSVAWNVR